MNNLISINQSLVGVGSFESYLQKIAQIPLLGEQEEKDLAIAYREKGCMASARQLVLAHLRFVVYYTRRFNGCGIPQADLVQEGAIGLMKAVKRFNPANGVRLITFAVHWIKSEIHDCIVRGMSIVRKVTAKKHRSLFYQLRKEVKNLSVVKRDEVEHIAENLGVKPADVVDMMVRMGRDESLQSVPGQDEGRAEVMQLTDGHSVEQAYISQTMQDLHAGQLQQALAELDERARRVVRARWLEVSAEGKKTTLSDLAEELGVSIERVRQIERQALKKIREAMVIES